MKLVLLQDVEKLGKKGDVAEVSSGYGVNFLVPKGLAMVATPDAMNRARAASLQKKTKKAQLQAKIASIGTKIDKKTFQIKVKASKSGRLYASLSKVAVTEELKRQWGLEGNRAEVKVDIAQPIRDAGRYPLDVVVVSDTGEEKHEIILSVVAE